MVNKMLALGVLSAALLLGISPCSADVAPTTLERLIKVCKYAIVGKVTRIIDVQGAKIAEAKVLNTLKGDSRINKVYFVAQPTWTCDTSNAVLNETVLLFLEPEPSGIDESSPFSGKLREALGNQPLLLISWSGRGRLPVTKLGQTDYVPVLADAAVADVKFPRQIPTISMPGSPNGRVRLARLEDVIAFIKRKAGNLGGINAK